MGKRIRSRLGLLFSVLCLLYFSTGVNAAVLKPQLDIQTLSGDWGVSGAGNILGMDATAISIITDNGPIDIPDVDFSLTAQNYSLTGGNGTTSNIYTFSNGSLTAGSLLTADFSNLTLALFSSGTGIFYTDLSYTGGSLMGSYTGGRIEGSLSAANSLNFSPSFAANTTIAKVGPVVVPIPPAVWLLVSGIIGLVGVKRRF
ncbi:exported hypothetical protein [uncultured Desulfobacterium sp.]|uniref:PEP-CTERM protein-sorting domain-containing protein n=1 Tax=uncultured Desulfobacterium sp. TaxID=201089 RepID=A0A445MR11_9BACT|nr:exported hypothetical protein [uncultured Desulfobacterium sp.]